MKRRIAAGEIGALRHLEGHFSGPPSYQTEPGNWRSNQVESPGGSMTARGCHVLDGMVHLAGLATEVFAVSERQQHDIDVDDTTSCLLRFAGGATGTLATLHAATRFYRIHAFGSKGALELRGDTELDFSISKATSGASRRGDRQGARGAGGLRRRSGERREIRDRAGGNRQRGGGDRGGGGLGAQRQGVTIG